MLFMHADGHADDKQEFLKFVSRGTITGWTQDDPKIRMYRDSTAIVTAKMHYEAKEYKGTIFATQVWIRQNGAWLFASHQTTEAQGSPSRR
jgi:hypothetical protein